MPPLTLHIADGRAVLTLANPEQGNRLNAPFMERMTGAVAELERRDDYRCLILRAQGPQFCVGGAIDEFIAADDFADHIRHTLPPAHDVFARLAALPVPIVAAIQGPVAGGGLGLALCADIVIGSDKAMFRAGYPAIGVSPDLGSSYHVLRRTGPTFAMALFMTNRKVEAIEALTAGLLNEAVPAAALDARIAQLAATLEAMPRASLAAIKRLISAPGQTLPDHMAKEAAEIISCAGTADAIEGITAFSENRPARFG